MYVVAENVCVYIYIRSYTALAVPSFKLDPIVLSPTGLYFPFGYIGAGGGYAHIFDVCLYVFFMCPSLSMYTHTQNSECITPNLSMLSFEANRFEANCLKSSGFTLAFILRKPQYSISTLHKYFNRSQRARPIP